MKIKKYLGSGYGVKHHFQQYFSYIMAVSFISGGNRCTPKKILENNSDPLLYTSTMYNGIVL